MWEKTMDIFICMTDLLCCTVINQLYANKIKKKKGVPFVAQRLMNTAKIHEDVGSIPGLTQWVKDLVLP